MSAPASRPLVRRVSSLTTVVCLLVGLAIAAGCAQQAPVQAPPPPSPSMPAAVDPPPVVSAKPVQPMTKGTAPPPRNGAQPVRMHRWLPVDVGPSAPWPHPAFGVYTYVLYSGPVAESAAASSRGNEAARRLQRLLAAIAAEGRAAPDLGAAERALTNLFVVPLRQGVTTLDVRGYDTELAGRYRLRFAEAVQRVPQLADRLRTDREGPFLLSTRQPVGEIVRERGAAFEIDTKQPILLVDLSGASDRLVAEVVAEFKRHVETVPLSGVESLEPLRIKLVSALLRLDQAIPFVATAVAGTARLLGLDSTPEGKGGPAKGAPAPAR